MLENNDYLALPVDGAKISMSGFSPHKLLIKVITIFVAKRRYRARRSFALQG